MPTGASAEAGKHFKADEEVVVFKDGQAAAMVSIDLLKKGWAGSDEGGESTLRFFVELTKPTPENGAKTVAPSKAEVLIRFQETPYPNLKSAPQIPNPETQNCKPLTRPKRPRC